MAKYAAYCYMTASNSYPVAQISNPTSAPRRGKLYDFTIGAGTAGDNQFEWRIMRHSDPVAGNAVTPSPLDTADPAAVTLVARNATAAANNANNSLMNIPLNQRATFRWVASPGGEIVWPASNNVGVHLYTPVSVAVGVSATVHFIEA